MRYILVPRNIPAYGQDFVNQISRTALNLKALSPAAQDKYETPDDCQLIITHDEIDDRVSAYIDLLPLTIPLVVHLHLRQSYLDYSQQFKRSKAIRRAYAVITSTPFLRDEIQKIFPKLDCRVIYSGINAQNFQSTRLGQRNAYRANLGLPLDARLLLFVGRIERAKGTQVLTELVKQISAIPNLYLLIQFPGYGESDSIEMFRERANGLHEIAPDRVILIEDPNPENERIVGYVDVAIHPSLNEVAPRVVKESWIAGVPVFATGSTPFYDEVNVLGARPSWLKIIKLPSYVQRLKGRANLKLNEPDAAIIAGEFINLLKSMAPMLDAERAELRGWAVAQFSMDRMLSDFDRLYNEALINWPNKKRTEGILTQS